MPFGVLSSDHWPGLFPANNKIGRSPMPFGVLSSDHADQADFNSAVTSCHQCLSAFCLLTTGQNSCGGYNWRWGVTNAFRRSVF
jgi:hypothetical protein